MIKLLLSGFLLSITCMTNAATVQHIEVTYSPIQFFGQNKKPVSKQTQRDTSLLKAAKSTDNTSLFLDQNNISAEIRRQSKSLAPYNFEENHLSNITVNTLAPRNVSNSSNISSLKSFTTMLDTEYGDNALVQESLSTLYEAKQLWQKADSHANAFASDIIFSLKLDKLIENDLSNTQQSLPDSSLSVFAKKNLNLTNQGHKLKGISFYQVQQAQANTSTQDLHILNTNFLHKLFRKTTLYYLVAFFICFSIIQFAIKFYLRLYP